MTVPSDSHPLLAVENLSCAVPGPAGAMRILTDVSFTLPHATALGIVGESGAGKSMLVKTIMDIAPSRASVTGAVRLDGTALRSLDTRTRRTTLGRRVGMVFQNPMTSLNPFVRVGRQVEEASRKHLGLDRRAAREKAIALLRAVGIPDAADCYHGFPHQFSGGMKQRIMIATALACDPELLIADEATTALDATVQKDILDLLQTLQQRRRMSMILVTHNLGVVAGRTDEVIVMYGGRLVEHAPTERLFASPRHRYTAALLSAMPRIDQPAHTRLATIPGQPPSLANPEPGCPFAPRCPAAIDACRAAMPPMTVSADGRHRFACHVPLEASTSVRQPEAANV